MARLDRPVARRRLVGMLARKGYGPGVALRAVDAELETGLDAAGSAPADTDEPPVP